jgi:2,3-dihydroxybenzoate decarboxylase
LCSWFHHQAASALASTRFIVKRKSPPRAIDAGVGRAMLRAIDQAGPMPSYKRIATEEAFATREQIAGFRRLLADGYDDPGFKSLWGFYLGSHSERARFIIDRLQDLGAARIADMDASGIDMQVLSLTSPGVQVFDAATANALAASSNDELADAIAKYPHRYAGLAACAPQDPRRAAQEIERGVGKLGLRGVIINSHTQGERLDDPKFWDIFAAAEALDVPVYLHPNAPPRDMIGPYLEAGLDGAVFGFQAETGLHMLRIIVAGVFDRFPKLKMIVGHCGEALPFWMYRIDYMHRAQVAANRYPQLRKLERTPGEYLRDNVYVTNSGVAWEPAIMLCHQVMGPDHTLYAMDYPYQYLPSEVTVSDELPMSDADKKKYFQTNAERLFKLVPGLVPGGT